MVHGSDARKAKRPQGKTRTEQPLGNEQSTMNSSIKSKPVAECSIFEIKSDRGCGWVCSLIFASDSLQMSIHWSLR